MNNIPQNDGTSALKDTAQPVIRTTERKIGATTFIVSSSFNESKERDIVDTIARLIQHDEEK